MSIATEIQRLQTAKTDVRTSLLKKGIYIPTDTLVSSFSTYIDNETPIPWKDNPSNYLSFYFIENGSVKWSTSARRDIYYSKDEGTTWTYIINGSDTTIDMNANEEIWFKRTVSNGTATDSSSFSSFVTTGKFFVRGDITSLCNFSKTLTTYHFGHLFDGCTGLNIHKDAPLILPRTTANYCYISTFKNCTSLTNIPVLPVNLSERCFSAMFYGCTALKTVPILPATTLASNCYYQMFYGCKSLINAPVLPATTLAEGCYQQMFRNCTSLEIAPELPAITLVSSCYNALFRGCSSLKYIKAMFTTTPSTSYTNGWVQNVPATGTFVKNSEAAWTTTGTSGIPSGWTVETASA